MPSTAIALFAAGTVVTFVVLAFVVVAVVDRVRDTVQRLLAVRDAVLPAVEQLQQDAERAQRHAEALRATLQGTATDTAPPT